MEENGLGNKILTYLAGFGGAIGALTAILYGTGFLITRAHRSMLGIWSELQIVKEAYLYEGGLFFVHSVYYLAFFVPFVLLVVGAFYVLRFLFSLIFRGLSKLLKRMERSKRENVLLTNFQRKALPFVFLILVIIVVPRFYSQSLFIKHLLFKTDLESENMPWPAKLLQQSKLKGIGFKLTKQSFSKLRKEHVPEDILAKIQHLKNQEYTIEEEKALLNDLVKNIGKNQTIQYKTLILKHALMESFFNRLYYGALVAGTLVIGLVIWYVQWEKGSFVNQVLRIILALIFIAQILLLPLNYGVLIKSTIYPKAYITTQEMTREQVWLLCETPDDVILYQNNSRTKGVFMVKKADIQGLHIIAYENVLRM